MYTRIAQIFSRKTFVFSSVNFSTSSLSLFLSLSVIFINIRNTVHIQFASWRILAFRRFRFVTRRWIAIAWRSLNRDHRLASNICQFENVRAKDFPRKKKRSSPWSKYISREFTSPQKYLSSSQLGVCEEGGLTDECFSDIGNTLRRGGGEDGHGAEFLLLYGDQSSRMISTFPSTAMPRELYAITHTHTHTHTREKERRENRERTPERAERWSRSYANALSNGCRGKLEMSLKAHSRTKIRIGLKWKVRR